MCRAASCTVVTIVPSTVTMRSPALIPASAAGDFALTLPINTHGDFPPTMLAPVTYLGFACWAKRIKQCKQLHRTRGLTKKLNRQPSCINPFSRIRRSRIDRFGLSWQIVPTVMDQMLQDKNEKKLARVTQAFLNMKKWLCTRIRRGLHFKPLSEER